MPIGEVIAFFTEERAPHKSYPVLDSAGRVEGLVSRAHVLRWMAEGAPEGATLDDLVSDASLLVGYPEEPVADLVVRMAAEDVGRAPIVDPKTRRLVGLVSRRDLMQVRLADARSERDRQTFFRLSLAPR